VTAIVQRNGKVCNPITVNQEIACSQYSEKVCGSQELKVCDRNCYWTQCLVADKEGEDKREVGGFCLSVNKNDNDSRVDACRYYYEFSMAKH